MFELFDLLLLVTINCIITAVFCILLGIFLHNLRNRDVENLYQKIESLDMNIRGSKGRASQIEMNEEFEAALGEAVIIFKGEGTQEEKIQKITGLAQKYPKVAMKLAKKFGLGI